MNLASLKPAFSHLAQAEQLALALSIRKSRQTPKVNVGKAKKTMKDTVRQVKLLTNEELELLKAELL